MFRPLRPIGCDRLVQGIRDRVRGSKKERTRDRVRGSDIGCLFMSPLLGACVSSYYFTVTRKIMLKAGFCISI